MSSLFTAVNSIAIVGNSGSELGAGNGAVIDARDLVIRFNNFSLDPRFVDDYGAKLDCWANSFNKDICFSGRDDALKIICGYPLDVPRYLERYRATNVAKLRAFQDRVEFVPVEIFRELESREPNPSSGLSVVYWIHQFRPLRPDDLFGFSCFSADVPHHYFDNDRRCGHDGSNEARILAELIA